MRTSLATIIAAAREHACPIIHISRLANAAPFVASSPCLGNEPVPLIELSIDDYLALMAELRNALVVELDETLAFPIFTGGGRDPQAARNRKELPPRTTSGGLDLPWVTAAMYYLMDSLGQETTIIYDGLGGFAQIQAYWRRRGEIWRDFVACYDAHAADLHDLSYHLDRTVTLDAFDVDRFASRRGLRSHAACAAR